MRRFLLVGGTALAAVCGWAVAAWAADDFNPPSWVDTDGNGKRDNRDAHFLEPGELLVIGVNPDWDPPAHSTSYHWHWWPTQPSFAAQGYYEEYDAFVSDTWYMPDHQQNLWKQDGAGGPWVEHSPAPMPRAWAHVTPPVDTPRWEGQSVPAGMPRGQILSGVHGGVTWSADEPNGTYGGVFEMPLWMGLALPETRVRLQYGGGYGSYGDYTYWTTTLEGFADGSTVANVPVVRTYRSPVDGTIYYEDWTFAGCPDWMRLTIDFTGTGPVDQVLIDTIAVPEPTTLALVGLGLARLVRRRRAA